MFSASSLIRALASAALVVACAGNAIAQDPGVGESDPRGSPGDHAVKLLSGGGRIWEGASVNQPTADVTFSGHLEKIGPGNTPIDYRCRWMVHFQDVQGIQYDNAVFTSTECLETSLWAAGGDPSVGMRVALRGELNRVAGYSMVMNVVDMTEPGTQDQVRFRLFLGEPVFGETNPPNLLYDTNWEFAIYPGTRARTYLDSGNLQSKVDTVSP